jgi:hypothetical protein
MRAFNIVIATCCFLSACIESEALNDQDQAENSLLNSVTKEAEQSVQQTGDGSVGTDKTVVIENASISRTQDFKVVTQQETIESDAAKLAALKQNYTVIEPEALPQRRGGSFVNLAAYALSQKHMVGTKKFRRFSSSGGCSRYRNNPDAAQREFLKSGGPTRDRKHLDGDGDGYACGWSPDKYRNLLKNIEVKPAVPTITELHSTDG